jgi:hypothetical protein
MLTRFILILFIHCAFERDAIADATPRLFHLYLFIAIYRRRDAASPFHAMTPTRRDADAILSPFISFYAILSPTR